MVLQTTTFDHSVTATNWSTRRESNPHPSGQGWRNLPRRFTTRLNFSQPLQWSSDFIRLNMRLLTTVLRPLSPLQRWLDFLYLKCKWQSKCPYYCLTPLITVSGYFHGEDDFHLQPTAIALPYFYLSFALFSKEMDVVLFLRPDWRLIPQSARMSGEQSFRCTNLLQ